MVFVSEEMYASTYGSTPHPEAFQGPGVVPFLLMFSERAWTAAVHGQALQPLVQLLSRQLTNSQCAIWLF